MGGRREEASPLLAAAADCADRSGWLVIGWSCCSLAIGWLLLLRCSLARAVAGLAWKRRETEGGEEEATGSHGIRWPELVVSADGACAPLAWLLSRWLRLSSVVVAKNGEEREASA
ncbi:hypothetical protein AABB24_036973 [Solanum stoloniferum]|uniref:Uncharacterized protein n=1 Tax=Solanum stoloniferum TaxID=62892 RepID=A0ABD2R2L7_9SOLN